MLTIMTPTYNRAYILPEAYRSLREQSCFDFEWIVVDDGSQDETEQLVRGWAAQCADFPIRYCRQPNGGKHRAVNRGVQLARGAWFLILDSDDSLLPCAVERIAAWTAEVAGRDDLAGVAGLKQTQGKPVGGAPRAPYVEASNAERRRFGLLGDKAEAYRTELMRRYPFPEFEGENFIRESVVWDRIACEGYRLRWYNEAIYHCNYIADGLTQNTNTETYRKNFRGYTACCRVFLEAHSGIWALHKCGEFHAVAKPKGLRRRDEAKLLGVSRLYYAAGIVVFQGKTALKRALRREKS